MGKAGHRLEDADFKVVKSNKEWTDPSGKYLLSFVVVDDEGMAEVWIEPIINHVRERVYKVWSGFQASAINVLVELIIGERNPEQMMFPTRAFVL